MNDILTVENLTISFGGLKAVDDLSFSVRDKEIFGLIGPNGAGKTTVFNCITQFYKPDSGSVRFAPGERTLPNGDKTAPIEVELVGMPVHKVIRHGLARTFQNVEIVPELSLLDNVLVGAHVDFKSNIVSQMLRLPGAVREEREYRGKAREALAFVGIDHLADQLAGAQPYGVRKRLEIARTLMARPRLIILDEPAAGLNEGETEELADTIRAIRDHFGCAVLLVEHDMGLVMDVCERICAISFGKLLAIGSPTEIQNDPIVHEAYLGERDDV